MEAVKVAALCLGLLMPSEDLGYPETAARFAKQLSQSGKERVLGFATVIGVWRPGLELADWDSFDGVYYLIRRRAQHAPLPYPIDNFAEVK